MREIAKLDDINTLVWVDFSEIESHPGNPNEHPEDQIEDLKDSYLDEGNAKISVSIQAGTMRINTGHGFIEGMKRAGQTGCFAVLRQRDDGQSMAWMLRDNKITEKSIWNKEKLLEAFKQLEEWEVNIDVTGFTQVEVDALDVSDGINDPTKLWEDMPEFEQEQEFYQKITISFFNESDVQEFSKLIGQKITPKTRWLHFPEIENFENKKYHYGT